MLLIPGNLLNTLSVFASKPDGKHGGDGNAKHQDNQANSKPSKPDHGDGNAKHQDNQANSKPSKPDVEPLTQGDVHRNATAPGSTASGPGPKHEKITWPASITLTPSTGPPGTLVTVHGGNFLPKSLASISFDGRSVATSQTNGAGSFSITFTVPTATILGSHTVKVMTDLLHTASANFGVTAPALTLTPSSGPVKTFVTLSGSGYGPNTAYSFCFQSSATAPCLAGTSSATTFTSTAAGAIPAGISITVPATGNSFVDISQGNTGTNFIVSSSYTSTTATLSLNPSSGVLNTRVVISGSGYAPNTPYSFCFQSSATAACPAGTQTVFTANASGGIPAGKSTVTITNAANHFLTISQGNLGGNSIISSSFTITNASLLLIPASGPVGTMVSLSGSGYTPNIQYAYCFQPSATTACPAGTATNFVSNATGAIPSGPGVTPRITVPGTNNTFVVISQGNSILKSAAYTVTVVTSPYKINLSPNSGTAGTPVVVTGTGFASSSSVTITFDGNSVTKANTDTKGTFSATFDIPQSYGGGLGTVGKTVNATDSSSHTAIATFAVTTTGQSTLTIATQDMDGNPLFGFFTYAYEHQSTPNPINSSKRFTPAQYTLNNQDEYAISVSYYGNWQFDHWLDTNSSLGGASPFADQAGKSTTRMISITSNTTITAVYRDVALSLSQSVGPAGTKLQITSAAFPANDTITLKVDGQTIDTRSTTASGTYSDTITIPSGASLGRHIILATDGTTANTHDAHFIVGPASSISLIPAQSKGVHVGDGVRVTGTGFFPNSLVELSYDGRDMFEDPGPTPYSVATDNNGGFSAIIEIVESVAGAHAIGAKDQYGDMASVPVTISPSAVLFPTSGNAGTTVNIYSPQANGFSGNSTATISFDGSSIATSTTDSTGSFGITFVIPANVSAGLHSIAISDTGGNSLSTSFNVTAVGSPTFSVQNVISGLSCGAYCSPTQFAFIPDNGPTQEGSGNFLVNMKNGVVYAVKNVNGKFVNQTTPFVTMPAHMEADAGLFSVAFDPYSYQATGYAYFLVTVVSNDPNVIPCNLDNTRLMDEIVRYKVTTDSSGNLVADSAMGQQVIMANIPATCDIDGGHIKFDSHGHLYISTGENYLAQSPDPSGAQDLTSLAGKILRITPLASPGPDGLLYSIPSDNPFASSTNPYIRKEIWGYGVRNPYTFDVDLQTGKVYASVVGLNSWEQIVDFTAASSNAGYSNYEGPTFGNPQNLPNYKEPIYWYPHHGQEGASGLLAITGATFYHCNAAPCYPSQLQGAYFFGDYGVGFINALLPNGLTIDPASQAPRGETQQLMQGLTLAPLDLQVWHGKIYYTTAFGDIGVLNYS